MEFSDYDGPFTAELQEAWPSLSEDQQAEIQQNANAVGSQFMIAAMFGDEETATSLANDVVREAHRVAGLPLPDVMPVERLTRAL